MMQPRTQPVEQQISRFVAIAQDDREATLNRQTAGQFSAADKRRIVAALRGCGSEAVDVTARECVVELADQCGFDAGADGRTRLTKADKRAVLASLREAAR